MGRKPVLLVAGILLTSGALAGCQNTGGRPSSQTITPATVGQNKGTGNAGFGQVTSNGNAAAGQVTTGLPSNSPYTVPNSGRVTTGGFTPPGPPTPSFGGMQPQPAPISTSTSGMTPGAPLQQSPGGPSSYSPPSMVSPSSAGNSGLGSQPKNLADPFGVSPGSGGPQQPPRPSTSGTQTNIYPTGLSPADAGPNLAPAGPPARVPDPLPAPPKTLNGPAIN
jgi:hypothetical protein